MATATTATVGQLERGLAAADAEVLEAFWMLAEQTARADRGEGEPPAVHELKATLEATKKTPDDFRRAVELKRTRLRNVALLEQADEARDQLDAAEEELAAHNHEWQARYLADQQKQNQLSAKVDSARRLMSRIQSAEIELRQTAPDAKPWLFKSRPGQATDLGRYMQGLQLKIQSVPAEINGLKLRLAERRRSMLSKFSPGRIRELEDELAGKERELEQLKTRFEQCQQAAEAGIVPDSVVLAP